MPNHVVNEIIFRGVDRAKQDEILAVACGSKGEVDFEVLLPIPLNVWRGSVGTRHEKALQQTGLDWQRLNWGTKWNAYSQKPIERTDDTLTLIFETAWRPPYGWLVAMFNRFHLSFDHNWLDEGAERGVCGRFNADFIDDDMRGEPWGEKPADDDMQKHLHKLRLGVEAFDDEAA